MELTRTGQRLDAHPNCDAKHNIEVNVWKMHANNVTIFIEAKQAGRQAYFHKICPMSIIRSQQNILLDANANVCVYVQCYNFKQILFAI